eukprot:12643935-Alexandrium_andersonii.AAC.1
MTAGLDRRSFGYTATATMGPAHQHPARPKRTGQSRVSGVHRALGRATPATLPSPPIWMWTF